MERNGGYLDNGTWVWSSVTLPNASYSVVTDYFFKGVRGVSITDSYIERIILESSSIEFFGCRCDNYRSNGVVDVDADSSLVAHELKHATAVLESVFVQSLSYNNTKYLNIPTSVWGPLRIATQTGTYQIQASERFNQFMNYEFADTAGGPPTFTNPVSGGILSNTSALLGVGQNTEIYFPSHFGINSNETAYYVWSVHTYVCEYDPEHTSFSVKGAIRTRDSSIVLGQVVFKHKQWACSYGIKKWVAEGSDPVVYPLSLYFEGKWWGGVFKLADYQVVKFHDLAAAQSFIRSRVFAETEATCDREG